jgi:hypothetical protein
MVVRVDDHNLPAGENELNIDKVVEAESMEATEKTEASIEHHAAPDRVGRKRNAIGDAVKRSTSRCCMPAPKVMYT